MAGFNKWKNQFERHVKKGEHGITIIAPTPYKKKIEEHEAATRILKAPILDADGKVGHGGKRNRNPHVPSGEGV